MLNDDLVIFCVDISGSMCVTSEMPVGHGLIKVNFTENSSTYSSNQVRTKKDRNKEFAALKSEGSQYAPGERRDISYVSRIECKQTIFVVPSYF